MVRGVSNPGAHPAGTDADHLRRVGRLGETGAVQAALPALLLAVAIAALALVAVGRRRTRRRQQAVARLLDAADALETRLRAARAEIEAVTGEEHPTRVAMQEMLRQRLWLQQHGAGASLAQIDEVRASLEQARIRIEQQLSRIQQARAPLA